MSAFLELAQSWTRCRLPISRPLPHDLMDSEVDDEGEWRTPLRHLLAAPGYKFLSCGRNNKDPEEVLFIIWWKDGASIKAFKESEGYAAYFEAFGIQESSPNAFFTIRPIVGARCCDVRITIFTLSFQYPVSEENRSCLNRARGLPLSSRIYPWGGLMSLERVWIQEPQVGGDHQLIENAMIIQPWSMAGDLSPDYGKIPLHEIQNRIQEAVDRDPKAREVWKRNLEELNALSVEETVWDMGTGEDEDPIETYPIETS